ncbi:pollen-specific leucine-rich repeat extensin-like protein 4 [Iris pallida]|uniref:Pollen-specific leucine-rich repeat extensin-like protein 4 n=1 Tax=Iris pallida TaxID=29817 RepID=A0AAX6HIW7_IRIPA|nr:pollen-specific leucine-rich repeat extensin-like protein 4 [Iris pallida]
MVAPDLAVLTTTGSRRPTEGKLGSSASRRTEKENGGEPRQGASGWWSRQKLKAAEDADPDGGTLTGANRRPTTSRLPRRWRSAVSKHDGGGQVLEVLTALETSLRDADMRREAQRKSVQRGGSREVSLGLGLEFCIRVRLGHEDLYWCEGLDKGMD